MRQTTFIIILLFSIQLNAQDFETFPVSRPSNTNYIELVKQIVRYNSQLITDLDTAIIYKDNLEIDKISLENIRYQVKNNKRTIIFDSIMTDNTIEFYQGDKLKQKKIFNAKKLLIEMIEYESNDINRKTKYKYDKKQNLISEQTFEYWSEQKPNLEVEIKYEYDNNKIKMISQKRVKPINKSYTVETKTFDSSGNILSLQTKMFSENNEIFLNKSLDFEINDKTNKLSKINSISNENLSANIDFKDNKMIMKINY